MDGPSPRSYHLLMAPQLGIRPWEGFPTTFAGIWAVLISCRNCKDNHRCCEFLGTMTLPCLEDSIHSIPPPFLWLLQSFCLLFCQRSFFFIPLMMFSLKCYTTLTGFIFMCICMKSSFLPIKCSFWWAIIDRWSLHVDFVLTEILVQKSTHIMCVA